MIDFIDQKVLTCFTLLILQVLHGEPNQVPGFGVLGSDWLNSELQEGDKLFLVTLVQDGDGNCFG